VVARRQAERAKGARADVAFAGKGCEYSGHVFGNIFKIVLEKRSAGKDLVVVDLNKQVSVGVKGSGLHFFARLSSNVLPVMI